MRRIINGLALAGLLAQAAGTAGCANGGVRGEVNTKKMGAALLWRSGEDGTGPAVEVSGPDVEVGLGPFGDGPTATQVSEDVASALRESEAARAKAEADLAAARAEAEAKAKAAASDPTLPPEVAERLAAALKAGDDLAAKAREADKRVAALERRLAKAEADAKGALDKPMPTPTGFDPVSLGAYAVALGAWFLGRRKAGSVLTTLKDELAVARQEAARATAEAIRAYDAEPFGPADVRSLDAARTVSSQPTLVPVGT